jgi:DNA-directed RNA polymerase specialized sigma24 family protein
MDATWMVEVVHAWRFGTKLDDQAYALKMGLPQVKPENPLEAATELARIGATVEQICDATNESERVALWAIDQVPPGLPDMLKLHADGMTPVQISRKLDIPRSRIYYHLHRRDMRPNRSNSPELTTRQRKAVVKAAGKGLPFRTIARRYLITVDQVRYAVKAQGQRP